MLCTGKELQGVDLMLLLRSWTYATKGPWKWDVFLRTGLCSCTVGGMVVPQVGEAGSKLSSSSGTAILWFQGKSYQPGSPLLPFLKWQQCVKSPSFLFWRDGFFLWVDQQLKAQVFVVVEPSPANSPPFSSFNLMMSNSMEYPSDQFRSAVLVPFPPNSMCPPQPSGRQNSMRGWGIEIALAPYSTTKRLVCYQQCFCPTAKT